MSPQEPFKPDRLIELLHAQYPQRTDVLRALQLCPSGQWDNEGSIQFISSSHTESLLPDKRFVERIILEDEERGQIIVKVVDDGRIAGIGFAAR